MHSILAFAPLIATVLAAPQPLSRRQVDYVNYYGDGSTAAGWPAQDTWVASFDDMWNINAARVQNSCFYPGTTNTSPEEAAQLKDAISQVSGESRVDARFILAVVMQETKGCVRAWETDNGVRNPGLMQSHNGDGTCNTSQGRDGMEVSHGIVSTPCPQSEILEMIRDGSSGTASGDGLQQLLVQAGGSDAQTTYRASRLYNSGSIAGDGNLSNGNGATPSYASDIANRLRGAEFDGSPFVPQQ